MKAPPDYINWPIPYRTVGNMLSGQVFVRVGCRKCSIFLEVGPAQLKAIAALHGEDYSLIGKTPRCRVVGCGGPCFFYASSSEHTPLRPLKRSKYQEFQQGVDLKRSRDGHFWVTPKLCGLTVKMMVDTGATYTVLSRRDAAALGINLSELPFHSVSQTAGGRVRMFGTRIPSIAIGPAVFLDQPVWVSSGELPCSLLGQSLMSSVYQWSVRGGIMRMRFMPESQDSGALRESGEESGENGILSN